MLFMHLNTELFQFLLLFNLFVSAIWMKMIRAFCYKWIVPLPFEVDNESRFAAAWRHQFITYKFHSVWTDKFTTAEWGSKQFSRTPLFAMYALSTYWRLSNDYYPLFEYIINSAINIYITDYQYQNKSNRFELHFIKVINYRIQLNYMCTEYVQTVLLLLRLGTLNLWFYSLKFG